MGLETTQYEVDESYIHARSALRDFYKQLAIVGDLIRKSGPNSPENAVFLKLEVNTVFDKYRTYLSQYRFALSAASDYTNSNGGGDYVSRVNSLPLSVGGFAPNSEQAAGLLHTGQFAAEGTAEADRLDSRNENIAIGLDYAGTAASLVLGAGALKVGVQKALTEGGKRAAAWYLARELTKVGVLFGASYFAAPLAKEVGLSDEQIENVQVGVRLLQLAFVGQQYYVAGINAPTGSPNAGALGFLRSSKIARIAAQAGVDCSEIAEDFGRAANGEGSILRFAPSAKGQLLVPETPSGGGLNLEQYQYHEVYSDGNFVYDPRLSQSPIDKNVYLNVMKALNPDATISVMKPK